MNQIYVQDLDNKWNICPCVIKWNIPDREYFTVSDSTTAGQKRYLSTTTYDGMWELYKVQLLPGHIKLCLSLVNHSQGILRL